MAHLKIIIFDVYSTLLCILKKCSPYKEILKVSPKPAATREYIVTRYFHDSFKLCSSLEKIGLVNTKIDLDIFTAKLQTELQSITMYDGVKEVLLRLKQQGYRLGAISNVATPYISAFYQHNFDNIIDYSIFSCEVGFAKPSPEIYEQLWKLAIRDFRQIGFEEMLMIGNNYIQDVSVPRKMGMQALFLDRFGLNKKCEEIHSLSEIFAYLQ